MTAGDWHEDVWCLDTWHEDVWADFGTGGGAPEIIILVAAPGAGVATHLQQLAVTVSVFFANATVSVDDGSTTYFSWSIAPGITGQPPAIDFGEKGFYWGKNKAIRLVISNDNATAKGKVKSYFRG